MPHEAEIGNIKLAERLQFRPRWWWDPVPDWVITQLDPKVLRQLAAIQIRFERNVLEEQMKSLTEVEKLIGRG